MIDRLLATDEQRVRVWSRMAETKFAAIYSRMCARSAYRWANWFSAVVGLTTAGSIASWTIWQSIPMLWAVAMGLGQILVVLKPYIPVLSRDKEYSDSSNKLERLFIEYEQLFHAIDRNEVTAKKCDKELIKLDGKAREIAEKEAFHAPDRDSLKKKACDERDMFLRRNFPEIQHLETSHDTVKLVGG